MLDSFIQWLLDLFRGMGYPGIVVLMAVESSILPLPSELVMPPAGYLAAKGEMSFVVAVACGVLGSVLGALANYGLAHWLGRAFFLRLGKYVLITERALDRSERYFAAHGEISTFLGRMLPVVRKHTTQERADLAVGREIPLRPIECSFGDEHVLAQPQKERPSQPMREPVVG